MAGTIATRLRHAIADHEGQGFQPVVAPGPATASATVAKPSRASRASRPARMRGTRPRPAVDEGAVELQRRGAGADLGVGVLGRGDAADADRAAAAPRSWRGAWRGHASSGGRAGRRRGRRPRRACGSCRPSRARVVLVATMRVDPGLGAVSTISASSAVGEVGGDLQEERHRPRQRAVRGDDAGEEPGERALPWRSRSRSVFGEETLTVAKSTKGPAWARTSAKSAARSGLVLVRPEVEPDGEALRPRRETGGDRRHAVVVEAEAVDDGAVRGEPEEPRPRVARLRARCRRADLEEAEAGATRAATAVGVLVHAGGEPERVRQRKAGERRREPRRRHRPAGAARARRAAPRARARARSPGRGGGGAAAPRRSARLMRDPRARRGHRGRPRCAAPRARPPGTSGR